MARLRYSLAQAEAEATKRAKAFIAAHPDQVPLQHRWTVPSRKEQQSAASKHPVAWIAVFQIIPPDGVVVDGGEVFVAVNLESGSIDYVEFL